MWFFFWGPMGFKGAIGGMPGKIFCLPPRDGAAVGLVNFFPGVSPQGGGRDGVGGGKGWVWVISRIPPGRKGAPGGFCGGGGTPGFGATPGLRGLSKKGFSPGPFGLCRGFGDVGAEACRGVVSWGKAVSLVE